MKVTRKMSLNMFRVIWICIILFFFSFYIHSLYLALFSVTVSGILIVIDALYVLNKGNVYKHTWFDIINLFPKKIHKEN